jgi:hypothetical protein
MATLSSGDIDDVHAQSMSRWSSVRQDTPITKAELRQLIVLVDAELETAETSIIGALPAGAGKDWLVANPTVGRDVIEVTERRRKEVL